MKIKLNVRLNITPLGNTFTVWPRPNSYLPGIEFHTGISCTLIEAITELIDSLPNSFFINDEVSVPRNSLEPVVIRPFEIVHSF